MASGARRAEVPWCLHVSAAVPEVSDGSLRDAQATRIARLWQRFSAPIGRRGVRRLPLGIAISVALHLAAVAWLATTGEARVLSAPHSEPVTVEIVAPAPPPPPAEPLAVALLDEPVAVPVAPAAPRPATRAAIRAGTTGHDEVAAPAAAEPAPSGPPGPRSKLMTMRGPELRHGLSRQWMDDLNARAKPLAPPVEPSGELSPSGGGRYRSEQGTFRVDVDRDGAAHITDGPNLNVHLAVPRARDIGNAVSQWAEDPYRSIDSAGRQHAGEYKSASDDSKPSSSNVVPVPLIGGGFDISDALMRRHGQDPYASKKLKVLDATRDERAQIGEKFRKEQLAQAARMMKAAVDRLWASGLDAAAKRRALFELWDDCADTGAPELVDAGARARGFVIGFINAHLPAGSEAAFTADELAQLNAHRQSRAAFAPYAP